MFFFFFSDLIWPAPLLAHTTFGPDRPLGPLFDQTVFCPNLCVEKLWLMELLFETICCSCLVFWAMDHPAMDPPLPKTTLCVVLWLWCVVVVCCVVLCCVV